MDYTLELMVVPVTDVDRAKAFYLDQLGFELEVDLTMGPDFRVVQLTPRRAAACSIAIGTGGSSQMEPGSLHRPCTCASRTSRLPGPSWSGAVSTRASRSISAKAGQTTGLDPERRSHFDLPDPCTIPMATPG